MADYINSKARIGAVYPDGAVDQQIWKRGEALITPEQLRIRHLFGIPLVSQIRDPFTNKVSVMTDDILKDYIIRAVNEAEFETGVTLFPVQFDERHPFDRFDFASFGYLKLEHKPVISIERMAIVNSNNEEIYVVDNQWISPDHLNKGMLYLMPLTLSLSSGFIQSAPTQGAVFLSVFAGRSYVPSFWKVKGTYGFPDGCLPVIVNELIGNIAAMKILSTLATTYARTNSTSLSIDAMSQSISTPGPQLFKVRMDELAKERDMLVRKIKTNWGSKIISGQL